MSLQNMFGNLALDSTVQAVLAQVELLVASPVKYTIGEPIREFDTQDIAPLANSALISYMPTTTEKLAFIHVSGNGDGDVSLSIDAQVVYAGYIMRGAPNLFALLGLDVTSGQTVTLSVTCNALNTSTFNATLIHG